MNYDPEQLREIADSNPGMSATMARGYASALERIKALEECVLELIDAQVIFEDALQYGESKRPEYYIDIYNTDHETAKMDLAQSEQFTLAWNKARASPSPIWTLSQEPQAAWPLYSKRPSHSRRRSLRRRMASPRSPVSRR